MKVPTPHWSQTSSRLMNACPRAWALSYARRSLHRSPRSSQTDHPPRTYDEILVRTMREAWLQRVDDQYFGKVWSNAYARRTVERKVDSALEDSQLQVLELHQLQGVERSLKQLKTLEETVALRPLFFGRPRRWAYFDRRTPTDVDGVDVYAAPDVAVFHQHRWTLVRLQFRAPKHSSVGQQLEHLLMVHWALRQPGFPDDPRLFRVKVVRWTGRHWCEHNVQITDASLKQAVNLVMHDVQEMTWLERWANADPSLGTLPLAVHHRHCRHCLHRTGCPADTGLAQAKRKQEHAAMNGHQSDATKSARTA